MALNGSDLPDRGIANAKEKRLPSTEEEDDDIGTPLIKIRTPGRNSRANYVHSDYIRLKRFDLISDDFSPHQAAKEGQLENLRDMKESGESLDERDGNGFCPIHHAVRANQTEVIKFLLDTGGDANVQGGKNLLTPLHISVRYNHLESAKLLLSHGADPSITTKDGATPLHFAARHGAYDFAEILLNDQRSDVNAPDKSGVTAFHLACVSGNLKLCELFLDHGADVLKTNADGKNALHTAAASGHTMIVELLIETGKRKSVDLEKLINARDFEDNTPLHLACKRGHEATVEVCLRNGADVDARNDMAFDTPLHVAAKAGQVKIVEILINYDANVSAGNALQRLPIHLASLYGHCEVIKSLINNKSPIDQHDSSSLTPFLCAVTTGRVEAVRLLIQCGADTSVHTESLQTGLHLAVHNKHIDVLLLLLDSMGTDALEIGDKNLRVPLHFCAYSNNFKMLELLLSKYANASPKDIFGKTPLHMAAASGSMECVKALVEAAPLHISDTDDTNTIPLHEAAMGGFSNIFQYLLRRGADITSKDSNRWTALHHAAGSGHVNIVNVLFNCSTASSSQIIDMEDSDGNTPLIVASKNGNLEVVRFLIKQKADISVRNKQKRTCLDVAVENGRKLVAMEIVKTERWYEVLRHRHQDHRYPMKDLIENMPNVAEVVMDKCMKYSDLDPKDPEYWIEFDFRLLRSDGNDSNAMVKTASETKFFAPVTMIDNGREDLISHPLTETYLLLRWNRLGRPIFLLNLIMYIIYITLFTLFLLRRRVSTSIFDPSDNRSRSEAEKNFHTETYQITMPFLITFFISLHMAKELYQIYIMKLKYFCHITNYLEWAGYITTLLYVIPYLYRANLYIDTGALWPIGASAGLLIYFNLILFLRRYGAFGIYVSMFLEVLNTMTKVVAVFSLFIFAFALTFHALLKEQEAFRTIGWSFVKTSMMTFGDIDYDSIITDSLRERNPDTGAPFVPVPSFTTIILLIFCFFLPVLFMNLLIGLAVGDIDVIQKNATMKKKAMNVEYLANIEDRYCTQILRYLDIPITVVYPNKRNFENFFKLSTIGSSSGNFSFDKIQPRGRRDDVVNSLEAELEEQKRRNKELQSTVGEQSQLLRNIAKRVKDFSLRTPTPLGLTLDEVDTLNLSTSDAGFSTPPAEL